MPSLNTISIPTTDDLELKKRTLALGASTTDILIELPPKTGSKDEGAKVIPLLLTPEVDDYPDGGPIAWFVTFGVRPSIGALAFEIC